MRTILSFYLGTRSAGIHCFSQRLPRIIFIHRFLNHQEHSYEYLEVSGTGGKELYEKVYEGRTSPHSSAGCTISEDPSGSFAPECTPEF